MKTKCLLCGKDVTIGHSVKVRNGKQVYVRENSGFIAVSVLCYDCLEAIGGDKK